VLTCSPDKSAKRTFEILHKKNTKNTEILYIVFDNFVQVKRSSSDCMCVIALHKVLKKNWRVFSVYLSILDFNLYTII